MSENRPESNNRLPPQTKYIVGNEACERFSYYGIRSILAGYITGEVVRGGLGQSPDASTTIIHLFIFANYFMPLFGAWLSDKLIGRYNTILYVSLVYCLGNGVLACSDMFATVSAKLICLASGLALIAFGSGGIKPCVSAFMGDQFKPEQGHLLQKAYGAFYWAINFGSFFSFLVVPAVKNHRGYGWAFGVPGILMALATLIFWLGTKHYTRVPPARQTKTAGFLEVFIHAFKSQPGLGVGPVLNLGVTLILPLAAMVAFTFVALMPVSGTFTEGGLRDKLVYAVGWISLAAVALWYLLIVLLSLLGRMELPDLFWKAALARHSEEEVSAARSVGPILFVFALIPVFWALFDQTTSTWVLQGQKMVPFVVGGKYAMGMILALAATQIVAAVAGSNALARGLLVAFDALGLASGLLALLLLGSTQDWNTILGPLAFIIPAAALLAIGIWGPLRLVRWVLGVQGLLGLIIVFAAPVRSALLALSFTITAEEMQSANPALVMILVPLLTLWVYPRMGRLATPLRRMSAGMVLASLSYVIVAWLQQRIETGTQMSVLWQTLPYLVLTTGEVLLSSTGLEFAFAESAPTMRSTIMSFWLLTVAFGNLVVTGITKVMGAGGGHSGSVTSSRFLLYAAMTAVVAVLFSLVASRYQYRHPSFRALSSGE
jgi:dipeptide/tripeptide permease